MIPEPKMSAQAPYKWLPCVVLTPQDVEDLLHALPKESALSARLRAASDKAAELTARVNEVEEHGRAA